MLKNMRKTRMSKITRNNLQLFCRICLSALQPSAKPVFNIHLFPNLSKLLIGLYVGEDNEIYPKSLCKICFDKLQDFQSFRSMALQSDSVLRNIINAQEICDNGGATEVKTPNRSFKNGQKRFSKTRQTEDQYYLDDDQLPLPEKSSRFCEKSVKVEPMDIENESPKIKSNFNKHPGEIKNEKDSECVEHSAIYEDNALGVHDQSTEEDYGVDDVDEEEAKIVKSNNFNKHPGEINEIESECKEHSAIYEDNVLGTHDQSTEEDYGVDDVEEEEAEIVKSNSSIENISTLNIRLVRKSDRNKKMLKCLHCDKHFYKLIDRDAHIRADHEGHEKPFLCMQCNKSFTRSEQLQLHTKSHQLKQLSKKLCSKLKSQKFPCNYEGCNGKFKTSKALDLHQKKTHLADPSPLLLNLQQVLEEHRTQLSKEIVDLKQICPQCCKKFSSKWGLDNHLKRHANIKEHICQECGVAKVTRTELLTHMRTHQPNAEKFKCNICPQEFTHKNAIQRHVRAVHEGLRPFPCSYCPKRFGTRNTKVCHERLHNGERPFACEICDKSFAQSESLKSHMKNHDKGLRTHVCKFCSQRFITRKNLIDHEERHRGDKPHICEVCNLGFSQRGVMLKHRSSHVESKQMKDVRDGNSDNNAVKNKVMADKSNPQISN